MHGEVPPLVTGRALNACSVEPGEASPRVLALFVRWDSSRKVVAVKVKKIIIETMNAPIYLQNKYILNVVIVFHLTG